ncbi:EAL domain-containing protein [Pediococcus pentosaceus]|uniref:EAL domain-containing protein n=1 Tax=Pediococcus pentosaceus TaxID=1255 RepID=UPI00237F37F2|nr:EAL domain-containing protein [Pediococcus pentosaceus]MDE3750585.1 EAL domain-containing protein [Pediococcus pentosaceus]
MDSNINLLEESVSDLCFFEQPIIHIKNSQENDRIKEYELLLREKSGTNRFPASLFMKFVDSDENNEVLMNWLVNEIKSIVEKRPNCTFSFNIDPQQLLFDSTLLQLSKLEPYKESLIIEITEALPSNRGVMNYYEKTLINQLEPIYNLGFRIAVDDVSSGMHSLNTVRKYTDYINRIKLSLIQLKDAGPIILKETVSLWLLMARENNTSVVIEGVSSIELRDYLKCMGVEMQQGFLWGKPALALV